MQVLVERLHSISPELFELFRNGSETQRIKAVFAACSKAISDTNLQGSEINAAMKIIQSGRIDVGLASKLSALSKAFDEKYFALGDDDNPAPPDALHLFQKARVSAALAFAISADRAELLDALYEAISASNDRAGIMQVTKTELTASE